MKRSLSFSQFVGFVFTSAFGTLLHFIYDWSNQSAIAAPFSAINESTWEHMKLLFFPMFIFALIQSRYFGKEYENFWCVKLKGILLGLILIPAIFYTYIGIFGVSVDFINIAIFFIAAAISYIFETRYFKKQKECIISNRLSVIFLFIIALLFIIFTFNPPQIPLFKDPLTGSYGLNN